MSLETWKAEFYNLPVESIEFKEKDYDKPEFKLYLLKHSLLKWEGARKENLAKHGLNKNSAWNSIVYYTTENNYYEEIDIFYFNIDSCSLCKYYISNECAGCPITHKTNICKSRQNKHFHNSGEGGKELLPYGKFIYNDDPEPMIQIIKDAILELEETIKLEDSKESQKEKRMYSIDDAKRIAQCWKEGKYLGAFSNEVIFTLLDHVEKLEKENCELNFILDGLRK